MLSSTPVTLYAFLSSIAQFRCFQFNLETDPDEQYCRNQAVKLINDLLTKDHEDGTISDSLMVAVAVMVNKEVKLLFTYLVN
jgi:hypothetical protein